MSEPHDHPPRATIAQVAVIGGGITGLTTALTLFHHGVDVLLLEAADRLGGKILTTHMRGTPIDAAADAFLVREPHMTDLCAQLNLTQDLVAPATGAAKIWLRGALRPLPKRQYLGVPLDLEDLEASGLLTPEGVARARQDLEAPADAPSSDEAVGALIRRRMGDEVMDRLVGPLLGGINAGDADQLSLQAGVPQLAAAAAHDASLMRSIPQHLRAQGRDPDAPVFLGHPNGTGQIVDAIATRLGDRVRLNAPVRRLERRGQRWHLDTGDPVEADVVVVTTPSFAAATLLGDTAPAAASMLDEIDYASVVFVTFAFNAGELPAFDGSGFLVPRNEGLLMTACSWASSKWAHLGDGPVGFLRVSAGHSGDTAALDLDDDELVTRLLDELASVAGVRAAPLEVRITRWPRSLPQYTPGHLERVAGIESALATEAPGITVAGAAYRGLGLPACVHQGRRAAGWARECLHAGLATGEPGTNATDRVVPDG